MNDSRKLVEWDELQIVEGFPATPLMIGSVGSVLNETQIVNETIKGYFEPMQQSSLSNSTNGFQSHSELTLLFTRYDFGSVVNSQEQQFTFYQSFNCPSFTTGLEGIFIASEVEKQLQILLGLLTFHSR